MFWRLFVEDTGVHILLHAEDPGDLMEKLLRGLRVLTPQIGTAWHVGSWCALQAKELPGAEPVTVERLQLFQEVAERKFGFPRRLAIDTEAGMTAYLEAAWRKAERLFAGGPPAGGEATTAATRPPAGDGKPDAAGSGGAGCADMTCAYCCSGFVEEEDYEAANGPAGDHAAEIVEVKDFTLLPPAPHLCQECATEHGADTPHNLQSLYYQTAFNMARGRAPTWADAMAHCSPSMRKAWAAAAVKTYAEHGIELPEELARMAAGEATHG